MADRDEIGAAADVRARAEFFARNVVEICSQDFTPLGQLRDWDTLEMVDRFCDIGQGKVNAVGSGWNRELVGAGATVAVKRDGVVEQAGPLEFGEDVGDTVTLKLNWKDCHAYLNERLCSPDPAAPMPAFPAMLSRAADSRQGFTSSVILGFVGDNAGPTALPERAVPGLVLAADPAAGVYLDSPAVARFDNLLTFCRQLAIPGGVGFRIETFDRQHTFIVYPVRDLSDDVVFSAAVHNVQSSQFMWTGPTTTHLTVGGKGQDALRVIAEVTSGDSLADAATWRRVEGFRDDNNAEGDALIAAARRDLAGKGSTISASFVPTNSALKYREDYQLGDLVTGVLRPGLMVVKPIREVTTSVSVSNGRRVVPVAGDYAATSSTGQQFQTRELVRVVADLNKHR